MQHRSLFSLIAICLLLISLLCSIFNVKFWKQDGQVIKWDVLEYYGYLPSTFIYKDLTLKFTEKADKDWGKRIWALTATNGNKVFKMTMGMAIMYAPFFWLAHEYAGLFNFDTDGYSAPYKFALLMSSLFYLFIGLFYLRKVLLLFFNDIIAGLTLIFIVAGTNLWYYASFEAPLSHTFSFSLISLFIWLTVQFYKKPTLKSSIEIGLLFGLISLIRPSNAVIILIFLFYGISELKHLKERIIFFATYYFKIGLILICSLLVWMPQFSYWHMQTGHWFYFSYAENGAFYFSKPQIFNGLFSFRKGWFLYTPIMLFCTLALPLIYKYARSLALATIIFVPVNVYIILSWWCWWYGGCFGQRAFIDSYALMAIPLAALLKWLTTQSALKKITGIVVIYLSILISIKHTAQYYYGAIHWDSMTKKAYWDSFSRLRPGPQFQNLIKEPDYEKALKGEEEY